MVPEGDVKLPLQMKFDNNFEIPEDAKVKPLKYSNAFVVRAEMFNSVLIVEMFEVFVFIYTPLAPKAPDEVARVAD